MPSGSHRTSGGSHRSGGSRSSGGSFSRTSFGGSRGGHMGPRPPFRMHFGTRVYVFGGKLSLFFPFILFALFAIIISSTLVSSQKQFVKNIKVDYFYYHQMILDAEANPELMKEAEVTDRFYNEEIGRWYYFYELETHNGSTLEGETYAIYTNEQISLIRVGDKIKVAVNSAKVTLFTDSVPIDFKNFKYQDSAEYIQARKSLTGYRIFNVLFWIVEVGLVSGMILYMVKTKKREDLEKQVEQDRAQEKHELETEAIKKELDWRCEYCGNKNKASDSKCENCGAGKK